VNSIVPLQGTIGNQAMQRMLQTHAEELNTGSATTASTRFARDFNRIPVHASAPRGLQPKLMVNTPGDIYEQEADRIADQVLAAPAHPAVSNTPPRIQRFSEQSTGQADTAPTSVAHALTSPGSPLEPALRQDMEQRFGYDFSRVRVHSSGAAERSAQDVSAHGYTVGHHMVFGAGRFAPGTYEGRRLIAHELTHVVQQQRLPLPAARGVSAPGDFHKRQAGTVAEALVRSGNSAPLLDSGPRPISHSLQRQPAPRPAPRPLRYDRTVYHLPAVPAGQTAASLKQQLNTKVTQREITSFTTRGGAGNTEIFLLATLFSLSQRARWGTETDVVAAIDWPAKAGDPAPLGQMTVRIDSNGAASAELIARGAPAATGQTTANVLQTSFKLAAVTDDGTARWSPAELNDVASALALLPPEDKTALEGVELIRVAAIPGRPDDAGQFEFPTPVASTPERVQDHAKLRLTSRAFINQGVSLSNLQFFGGTARTVPSSFHTILHEGGHAVESSVYREKWRAHAQALADTHAASKVEESDARKKERQNVENKLKTAKTDAEKNKLEQKIAKFDVDLALIADKATDKKAAETKLKEKEKEVTDLDAAGQTQRLRKFLALGVAPFTDYSRQGDKEFYAEAYSLWLVDPEFLRTNYRVVFDFFQNGDYRN
jgi:hypothetical protein